MGGELIFYFKFLAAIGLGARVRFDFLQRFSGFALLEILTKGPQFHFHFGPPHVRSAKVLVPLVFIKTIVVHMLSQQDIVGKLFFAHIAFK